MKEGKTELTIGFAYRPFDSKKPPSTKEVRKLLDCNSNVHHIVWGSTGINKRDESHLEFSISNELKVTKRTVTR